ncbi:MAG: ATP-binding domain-containing protein [Bacteroidetes bacterium]|nr:ATP-binding domain-containing protein [Bacteroidota bacterium]
MKRHKFSKELYTRRPGGELPSIVVASDENLQSRFIVQKVLELREQGIPLDDIAVLFRSGFLSFDLEIELNKANIPFAKFGGFKFIETAHIKDLIAYLRVLENPRDAVAWNRILLLIDGVGPRTAQKVIEDILARRTTTRTAGTSTTLPAFWADYNTYPENVRDMFDTLKEMVPDHLLPADKVQTLLNYYHPIFTKRYDDHNKRKKDLEMFHQITERYRSLISLLGDIALEPVAESVTDITPPGTDDEKLVLSTIHSAKGLEWHSVFVIYALEGRFPATRAATSEDSMEEERRLMYVACTRAKENLFITYPINIYDRESGLVLSKPSRFIADMPEQLLEDWLVDEE